MTIKSYEKTTGNPPGPADDPDPDATMDQTPTESEVTHRVILFDGVCNLCERSVRFIIKRDPKARFSFASLQSEAARQLLERHGLRTDEFDTMVLIESDTAYTRSDAAVRIAGRLSGPYSLLAAGRIVPRPIRDWLYDLIARNRYRWFGRKDRCLVPTDEVADRFID